MEKCSLKKHIKEEAIIKCRECHRNMCKICYKHHSELFDDHNVKILETNDNKDLNNLFTGFCKEENHSDNLDYFCKNHNKLCCAACISKIKSKGNGQHTDCEVCNIDEIKEEKEKLLKENAQILQNLSNQLEELMGELKNNFEKITRESLKKTVQDTFIQIKKAIDEREKEVLSKIDTIVDDKYDDLFSNEKRKYEPTYNEIEKLLNKSKEIDEDWSNPNKISSCVNDCLNIENNVKILNNDISKLKENIGLNNISPGIKFYPEGTEAINSFLEKIKKLGYFYSDLCFKFEKCPENIKEDKLYRILGQKENVVVKSGTDGWVGVPCINGLGSDKDEYSWKINILETHNGTFMVGVAPKDFDINKSTYTNSGWYFYAFCSVLYSGAPFNYKNKKTHHKKVEKEIKVVMNMRRKTLKFIVDGEDKGESYSNIPTDKPLVPVVFLYHKNDSVEIIDY